MTMWGDPPKEAATVALAMWQWHFLPSEVFPQLHTEQPEAIERAQFLIALELYRDGQFDTILADQNLKQYYLARAVSFCNQNGIYAIPACCRHEQLADYVSNFWTQPTLYFNLSDEVSELTEYGYSLDNFLQDQYDLQRQIDSWQLLMERVWLVCAESAVEVSYATFFGENQSPAENRAYNRIRQMKIWQLDQNTDISEGVASYTNAQLQRLWDDVNIYNQSAAEDDELVQPLIDLTLTLEAAVDDIGNKLTVLPLATSNNPNAQVEFAEDQEIENNDANGSEFGFLVAVSRAEMSDKLLTALEHVRKLPRKDQKRVMKKLSEVRNAVAQLMKMNQVDGETPYEQRTKLEQALNTVGSFLEPGYASETDTDLVANEIPALITACFENKETGIDFWSKKFWTSQKNVMSQSTIADWAGSTGLMASMMSLVGLCVAWQRYTTTEKAFKATTEAIKGVQRGTQFLHFLNKVDGGQLAQGAAFSKHCTWVGGGAGAIVGTLGAILAVKDYRGLSKIRNRWKVFHSMLSEDEQRAVTEDEQSVLYCFSRCERRIKGRKFRTAVDGFGATMSVGQGTVAVLGTFFCLGAATPLGWAFLGVGLTAGLGRAAYKFGKRNHKKKLWKDKLEFEIMNSRLPPVPVWCGTRGDYYRWTIAMFIFYGALDLLPDAGNARAKGFAWVLFGGGRSDDHAIELGIEGIAGYLKG